MRRPVRTLASALVLALALVPCAVAQGPDPAVNDSDFDTTPPPADDAYLNDTNASSPGGENMTDPTVSDSDFDTSPPPADTGYLDDAERGSGGADEGASATPPAGAKTPAPSFALLLGAALAAAATVRHARRSR